jgi:hypothetical protein
MILNNNFNSILLSTFLQLRKKKWSKKVDPKMEKEKTYIN